MTLINGKKEHCVSVSDRGFQYGDGLFETIEINNGQAVYLDLHLARLKEGCRRLLVPFPGNNLLKQEIGNVLKDYRDKAVLKIILTRGIGGRGYRQPDSVNTTRVLSLHPYPEFPESFTNNGVNVRICQMRLGQNPALAGLKHLNRLEQIIARSEWNSPDIQEGLMLDQKNHVIEGTATNVFVVKGDCLYTPELDKCGVAGIIRDIVIFLARKNNLQISITRLSLNDVLSADEIFLTNSIIGIWPVKTINHQAYAIGETTRTLIKWLTEHKDKNLQNV